MALAGITNTFVAQLWGRGDRIGCSRATAQGICFALLSAPLILCLMPIGLAILNLIGHEQEILVLEKQYFKILLYGGGGMVLSSALSAFFSGRGRTRVVMSCNIIANLINVILNYLFVFGRFGLPEMGIIGAAWGSVISSWICLYCLHFYILAQRNEVNLIPLDNYVLIVHFFFGCCVLELLQAFTFSLK